MAIDDLVINKTTQIRRCLERIRTEYGEDPRNLLANQTKQDSIILNLQRAVEMSVDLGMYLVRKHNLGIPQTSREAFELLHKKGLVTAETLDRMKKMVGFRNIAVHDYTRLDLTIVQAVIDNHLQDFETYLAEILPL
jgi:uncharacterized protein YutE (UPF0331/DUF86 family)